MSNNAEQENGDWVLVLDPHSFTTSYLWDEYKIFKYIGNLYYILYKNKPIEKLNPVKETLEEAKSWCKYHHRAVLLDELLEN